MRRRGTGTAALVKGGPQGAPPAHEGSGEPDCGLEECGEARRGDGEIRRVLGGGVLVTCALAGKLESA